MTPDPDLDRLVHLIRGEFREMPGSCLSIRQAARLWHVPPDTAQRALDSLVAAGLLRVAATGYVRNPQGDSLDTRRT